MKLIWISLACPSPPAECTLFLPLPRPLSYRWANFVTQGVKFCSTPPLSVSPSTTGSSWPAREHLPRDCGIFIASRPPLLTSTNLHHRCPTLPSFYLITSQLRTSCPFRNVRRPRSVRPRLIVLSRPVHPYNSSQPWVSSQLYGTNRQNVDQITAPIHGDDQRAYEPAGSQEPKVYQSNKTTC